MLKDNIKAFLKKHGPVYGILLLYVLVFLYPYLQRNLVIGADYMYHLARIQTIAENLRAGEFPVKIHNGMNLGYGYGSGFFYPNFFFYIPAVWMLMGISLWNAYKGFVALIALGIALSMYHCGYYMAKKRVAGVLSAVSYLFCQPLLMDLYYRFAPGECIAFIFVPIVLVGCHNLFREEFDKPWLLGMGFLGLGLAHPVTIAGMLLLMVCMCIVHIRVFVKNPAKCRKLLITGLVVLALSISYWLPMVEQVMDQTFHFMEPWTNVDENVASFCNGWIGTIHSMGYGMILMAVLGLGCVLFIVVARPQRKESFSVGILWTLIGVGMALLATWKPFWTVMRPFLNFLQFPWRIHLFACAFLCLGSVCLLLQLFGQEKIMLFMTAVISCFLIFGEVQFMQPQIKNYAGIELLDICADATSNGGGEEWQPAGFTSAVLNSAENTTVFDDRGNGKGYTKQGSRIRFSAADFSDFGEHTADAKNTDSVKPSERSVEKYAEKSVEKYVEKSVDRTYRLPYVYYKGYRAVYYDGAGNPIEDAELMEDPETHMLLMKAVDEKTSGYYEIYYAGTLLQKVSYLVCMIAWLALAGVLFMQYLHRKKGK